MVYYDKGEKNMLKRLFILLILLIPCLLLTTGCTGGEKTPSENDFSNITSGEKIYITSENYQEFVKVNITYSAVPENDSYNSLAILGTSEGYSKLSYFNVVLNFKVTASLLIESGAYENVTFYVSAYLDKSGNCSIYEGYNFGTPIRNIKDVQITVFDTSGFIVKK